MTRTLNAYVELAGVGLAGARRSSPAHAAQRGGGGVAARLAVHLTMARHAVSTRSRARGAGRGVQVSASVRPGPASILPAIG